MVDSGQRCVAVLVLALAVSLGPGCASEARRGPEATTPAERDARIAAQIRLRIEQDSRLDATRIRPRVVDGIATLEGVVGSAEQVRRALRHAAGVEGVVQVINRLLIVESRASAALRAAESVARTTAGPFLSTGP